MRSKIALVIAAATLGACAPKSGDIPPSYVSPVLYQNYTCQQLEQEALAVSARAVEASVAQDNAFALGGDRNTATELASLKGQLVAIEQASIQKNCGIQFQERPATKPRPGIFHF